MFDIFVTFVRELKKGVVAVDDNKKVTSMLFKFSHSFLAIGFVIVMVSLFLVGWNFNNIGMLTGFGFILSSVFLYIISGALNAVFSFEKNLEAVKRQINDPKVRPLWK